MTDSGGAGIDEVDVRTTSGAQGGGAVGSSGTRVTMIASKFYAEWYNMNHERRGKAIIFNNKKFDPSTKIKERTGTDIDAGNLSKALSEIGFEVFVEKDCTSIQMESILVEMAKEDHSNADCFACAILSHGEEGCVYGKDGPIEIDTLVSPFKGKACQSLVGKPKIFFIQACRERKYDDGVDVIDAGELTAEQDMETDSVEIYRIPAEADFLMAYSIVPGYYAWRNSAGSCFIQALVDVLRENWRRKDLLSMMTRVSRKVAFDFDSSANDPEYNHKKQILCITSMLTRDVYFH